MPCSRSLHPLTAINKSTNYRVTVPTACSGRTRRTPERSKTTAGVVGMEPAMRRHSEAHQRLPPGHVPAGKKDVTCFQMPLHYPSYTKAEYETMPEWKLDRLLAEYGLPAAGDVAQKRNFAIGAFLWASRE